MTFSHRVTTRVSLVCAIVALGLLAISAALWIPPGALGEDTSQVDTGHVFVSHDAGENFTDVSGDIPDAPADWVLPYNGKLIVGADVDVFLSSTATGGMYSLLGDLPPLPVVHLSVDPAHPKRVIAATYARDVYGYTFA